MAVSVAYCFAGGAFVAGALFWGIPWFGLVLVFGFFVFVWIFFWLGFKRFGLVFGYGFWVFGLVFGYGFWVFWGFFGFLFGFWLFMGCEWGFFMGCWVVGGVVVGCVVVVEGGSKRGLVVGSYRDWETDRKSTRLNSSH